MLSTLFDLALHLLFYGFGPVLILLESYFMHTSFGFLFCSLALYDIEFMNWFAITNFEVTISWIKQIPKHSQQNYSVQLIIFYFSHFCY